MPNITNLPNAQVPWLDERTGLVDRTWYLFLQNLFTLTGGGSSTASITDILTSPVGGFNPGTMAYQDADNVQITGGSISPLALFGDASAGDAFVGNGTSVVPVLSTGSDAYLRMSAANVGKWQTPAYGQLICAADQPLGGAGTAQAITFNNVIYSVGTSWNPGAPTTLTILQTAVYMVTAQLQVLATGVTLYQCYAWLRVNGVDIDNTAVTITAKGDAGYGQLSVGLLYTFRANDYVEVMWTASNAAVSLNATAAAGAVPAIPAAILSLSQVSA